MIKLVSAYGFNNVGDRLSNRLLRGYIETYTNNEVALMGGFFEDTEKAFEELKKADAIIIGAGGCLLHYKSMTLFNLTREQIDAIDKPLIIMSSGFNIGYNTFERFTDREWVLNLKTLLDKADLVGLRTPKDIEQARLLSDNENVCLCPDPLLLTGYDNDYEINSVGFALGHCETPESYREFVYYALNGYRVKYIYHEPMSFEYDNSILEYADCDFVITRRFHGGILSAGHYKPFFVIGDNVKHEYLYDMFYPKDIGCYGIKGGDIYPEIRKFLSKKEILRKHIKEIVPVYRDTFVEFCQKMAKVITC